MTRLQQYYQDVALPKMMEQFGYTNRWQVTRFHKISINMGVGIAAKEKDAKITEKAAEELAQIVGQKPVITRSKKAIANFHLQEKQPIGVMVTLRRQRMFEFFDRLVNVALPRVRDFKGVSPTGFDGRGNYTLGLREHSIFPEINIDKVDRIKGMNVTVVTTAWSDRESLELLRLMGMPFRAA